MAVSLKKGQGVSLKKAENDLSTVTVGLGWDVREEKVGLLASIFGGGKKGPEYDLDAVAFLLGASGKIGDLGKAVDGKRTLTDGDIVFFNSKKHKSGAVWLTGDNRTGAGDGDDEQIVVKLNDLPGEYERLVFVVQIYQGKANQQSFGDIANAFIRAVDARGREMVRFDLVGGQAQRNDRSMLFAELSRESGGWKFNAIGDYMESDSFVDLLKRYI